jgi:hypothetical protein
LSIAVVDRLDKHFRRLTKNVFARYGFAYAGVLAEWSAIVGEEYGRVSVPERIRWPRSAGPGGDGRKRGGTIVVRVAEGRALEFQHLAPLLIERINSYLRLRGGCGGQGPAGGGRNAGIAIRERLARTSCLKPSADVSRRSTTITCARRCCALAPRCPVATARRHHPQFKHGYSHES